MTLINIKPRPIERSERALRDDRLFIIACDDTYAPKQYFNFIKLARVQVHVIPAVPGAHSAEHVLQELLKYEHQPEDERWLLLDTDHYVTGSHIRSFLRTISDAEKNEVKVALSKPCFEVWLLLHHLDESVLASLQDAEAVIALLKTTLNGYNKTNLQEKHYPLVQIAQAYIRAKKIDSGVRGGKIPKSNTTRIFRLLELIVSGASPSQLPAELRAIKEEMR